MQIVTYKNHTLYRYIREDDVGEYYEHETLNPDGSWLTIDFVPWQQMSKQDFAAWIDLGKPDRYTLGLYSEPFGVNEIRTLWDKTFRKQIII